MNLDILSPNIFPKNRIVSGVTKINKHLFPKYGFSLSKGEILSDFEVNNNRKILADYLQTDLNNLKFQKQIHSDIVQIVDNETTSDNQSDAMITNKKNIFLNVLLADCLGILLFDIENNTIAAVHSGWRGTKKKIITKTIEKMKLHFNSKPQSILAYLTPCASGETYEVGYDVAKYFPDYVKQIKKNKYLFDNRAKIYDDLIKIGINPENIEKSEVCTIKNNDYHSFRRDKEKSGRMAAFIAMK